MLAIQLEGKGRARPLTSRHSSASNSFELVIVDTLLTDERLAEARCVVECDWRVHPLATDNVAVAGAYTSALRRSLGPSHRERASETVSVGAIARNVELRERCDA
jgi:hypothetical protein